MRGDEKRNFLGIVMGGCGRYVFFYFFLFFGREGGNGDREGGMFWFRDGMEWNDVWCLMYDEC